jgi:cell division septal protein FtsQ
MNFLFGRKSPKRRCYTSRDFCEKVKNSRHQKRLAQPLAGQKRGASFLVLLKKKHFRSVSIGLVALIFYFVSVSDYFVVVDFQVENSGSIDKQSIEVALLDYAHKKNALIVPNGNILLMSLSQIENQLKERFPLVKEVTGLKKIFPNKVVVSIQERIPGIIIVSNGQSYLVDDEGVVFTTEIPADVQVPVVTDQINENYDLNSPLPNTKLAAFIISMSRAWDSKISAPIKEVKIPGKSSSEAHFVSLQGWTALFDANRSAAEQLKNLSSILTREIPREKQSSLSYVDLRSGNWAYYCYVNSPCVVGTTTDGAGQMPQESK